VNIDGVTGIVVPPNDPAALRNAMHTIDSNPELASDMGRRARERFDTLFTANQMGRSYVDLYRRVLGETS
jgi:rhamnosyl/mannosyltransferase